METPNKETKSAVLIALTLFAVVGAFGIGLLVGRVGTSSSLSLSHNFDAEYIERLLLEVEEKYLGELPSAEEITQGMAKGLIQSLDDQYSAYLDPEEADEYLDQNASAYEGIGVQLGYDGQYTTVVTPIDGYPGQVAGMLKGDIILEVDGEDVAGQRPEIVATKIRGKAGTVVKIKLYREESTEVLDLEITREAIDLENLSYEQLDNGVVVIDIVKFTEGADGLSSGVQVFNRAWDELVGEAAELSPTGIVLDLRNNPGGYVDSVRYVAEEFLKKDMVIMREQAVNSDEEVHAASRTGRFADIPVVVLVNEASASSAEILAAAIQDNERGEIVGQPTVGKGVEQQVSQLSDGSLLLLVFRRWLTPDGRQISEETPIQPDYVVEYELGESGEGSDAQLQKALEVLSTD